MFKKQRWNVTYFKHTLLWLDGCIQYGAQVYDFDLFNYVNNRISTMMKYTVVKNGWSKAIFFFILYVVCWTVKLEECCIRIASRHDWPLSSPDHTPNMTCASFSSVSLEELLWRLLEIENEAMLEYKYTSVINDENV